MLFHLEIKKKIKINSLFVNYYKIKKIAKSQKFSEAVPNLKIFQLTWTSLLFFLSPNVTREFLSRVYYSDAPPKSSTSIMIFPHSFGHLHSSEIAHLYLGLSCQKSSKSLPPVHELIREKRDLSTNDGMHHQNSSICLLFISRTRL